MTRFKLSPLQWTVHLGALAPLAVLIADALRDNLTANPIQEITFRTGKTALILLVLSLAATPINTVFGFHQVLKVRRALGLYAFFYVSVHFLIFIGLDYLFDPGLIYQAIFEKRYALVGFAAGLILLPLAVTSTKGWKRRLGKNWKRLHRFAYLAALLGFIHYLWLVKADVREPLLYGGVIIFLLLLRLPFIRQRVTRLRSIVIAKIARYKDHIRRTKIQMISSDIENQKAARTSWAAQNDEFE